VDGGIDAMGDDGTMRAELLDGTSRAEAALVVQSGPRATVVFNDAVFNHAHLRGAQGWVFRALGSTGGPRVTWIARMAFVRDKPALAAHLRRLAESQGLARVLVSHGSPIERDAAATLRAVADRLATG
jgi:hypothetical protein